MMMALPFFEVLYYVQISTLFVVIFLEGLCMGCWILFFHKHWRRKHPPLSTVIICDELSKGNEIAKKINFRPFSNRVDEVVTYNDESIYEMIESFDAVILIKPPLDRKNDIALECWNQQKELIIVPDVYELIVNNAVLVQFDDVMTFRVKSIGLTQNQAFFKRVIDILGSFLALILLSPLMLVIAAIVKRDGGPALFSQNRVTKDGKVFRLYKFRTMIPDAEKHTGPTLAKKEDPRITKAGKWLRQTRMDEIPQFWNVLIGDMSIVGPRPEREHFINLYLQELPEYQFREKVRAGITGLAHVLGKYNTTPEERIKLDLTYIQNYTFFLDIKILIETVRIVLTKGYAEGIDEGFDVNEQSTMPEKRQEEKV
jgi:exopolysaccharide biosynthesis polyprenyl glycosylphosphotransferase